MPGKRYGYWRIGTVEAPEALSDVWEARRAPGVRREPVYKPPLYAASGPVVPLGSGPATALGRPWEAIKP